MQTIKNYRIQKPPLGSGNYGTVYLAEEIESEEKRAIKVIPRKKISNQKLLQLLRSEISIMKSVKSENVIKFYEYFEIDDYYYIVMEYCKDGSLESIIKKQLLTEKEALIYFKQILNGFKALHEQGVIHRDFKPANVLLHGDECKICDLGFAKQADLADTVLGTPLYMAPEVLDMELAKKNYNYKIDIYSLGVSLYEVVFGKLPFFANSTKNLLNEIKKGNIDFSEKKYVSEDFVDLVTKMLKYSPEERIDWQEIYKHKIINTRKLKKNDLFGSLVFNYDESEIQLIGNKHFYKNNGFKEREQEKENSHSGEILEGGVGTINKMFAKRAENLKKQEEEKMKEHSYLKARYLHQKNLVEKI
jgi:serine/threonine protein kinase